MLTYPDYSSCVLALPDQMHERLTRETDILSGSTRTFSIVPVQLLVYVESHVRKGLTEAARFPWNATGGQAILHTSLILTKTKKKL